jgi:diguanylate cyclase (GGDEF)-like protein
VGEQPQRPRAVTLALKGMLLGVGAPLGWLVVEALRGHPPAQVLENSPVLLSYQLLASMLVFAVFGWVMGSQEDRLMDANRQLDVLSVTDPLTGLRNRRYFLERLDEAIALATRGDEPLALAIIDLDHFKRVNDRHGHPVGDKVLEAAADAMADTVRRGETLARVGGEEFAVLLPGLEDGRAELVGERLRQAIADGSRVSHDGEAIGVTASVGVGIFEPLEGAVGKTLYAVADEALYEAKRAGRDRVVVTHLRDAVSQRPSMLAPAK